MRDRGVRMTHIAKTQKDVFFAFSLIASALILLALLPAVEGATIEDMAIVRATVTGFSTDLSGNSFVGLRIEEVLRHIPAAGSGAPELIPNSTFSFGYLWGHQKVTGTFPVIRKDYIIIANISLHRLFTTHVGHLYSYELVCGEDEILMDGECVPEECEQNERRVGNKCVILDCGPKQGYRDHACYDLDCDTDEKVENHLCVKLICADDEFASNHLCHTLDCGINEIPRNHECVPLICGVFTRADNNICIVDWVQIAVFILAMSAILFLIYYFLIKDLFSGAKKGGKTLGSNTGVILVFVVALVVLALPMSARLLFHSSYLAGPESYRNHLISTQLMDGKLDYRLGTETKPYHLLEAYLGGIFGIDLVARLLPIILGTFSATLFYLILKKIINDVRTSTLTAIVLIFSPAFMYLFSVSSPNCLTAFILLFATYLLLSSRKMHVLFGGIMLSLASLTDPFVFALSMAISILIIYNTRNSSRLRKLLFVLVALAGIAGSLLLYSFAQPAFSIRSDFLRQSITDMGGVIGFGLFHIILFFSGLLSTWKMKREYALLYLMLALVFILMLALGINYNAYLNFLVVYFMGVALSNLAAMKWESLHLKNIALLILFCGLLFSGVSYAKRIALMEPEPELVQQLENLRSYPGGIVLSHPKYAESIEYFGGMPAYFRPEADDAIRRINISEEIFNSRRLEYTKQIMDEENIRYVVVTMDMRKGLVWDRENEGLLFLFRNNETFKKLYGNEVGVEVWEYLSPDSD